MGDVASPFFPDVARGAEDVLASAGYSLILSSSRRDRERELRNVKHLLERSTDGLILGAPQCRPDELAELAQRAAVPMVFLNREVQGPQVAAVWVDWPTATAEVVTYLAGLGHRRIALVVPSRSEARVSSREDWYRPALTKAGLGARQSLIFRESMSLEGGYRAGERLLALADRPTAAICHNDVMAIGLLQACAQHKVRVPRDLSIVGWDDVPYASLVTPPLTTVRVPRYELGQTAAHRLLDLMAGRAADVPGAPLALQLVHRQSCRAPGERSSRAPDRQSTSDDPLLKGGTRGRRRSSSSAS
jgi:DNA-binding LacI/PurR family transcriptional regulator